MLLKPFSNKQRKLIKLHEIPQTIVVVDGAVRTGKTTGAGLGFAFYALSKFKQPTTFLLSAPKMKSILDIQKPMIDLAAEMIGLESTKYSIVNKEFMVDNKTFACFSAHDEKAKEDIQGMAFGAIYIEEGTNVPQSFIDMALTRKHTQPESPFKMVICCNPGNPHHFIKSEFIDKDIACNIPFTVYDNPSIDNVEEWLAAFEGMSEHEYRRLVHGEWLPEAGAVYTNVPQYCFPILSRPEKRYVALDHAASSATHAVMVEQYADTYFVTDELRINMQDEDIANSDQCNMMVDWIAGRDIDTMYIDPAASGMKAEIRKQTGYKPISAKNEVLEGINTVRGMFENYQLFVSQDCKDTIKELHGYEWDKKASEQGIDKPKKQDDHACDALRYFCHTIQTKNFQRTKYVNGSQYYEV